MAATTSKPATVAATAVTATAVILATVFLHQKRHAISAYYKRHRGIRGFIQYIWIGDCLPPHIRESMDELDTVDERMAMAEVQLESIEILVERTLLESVDGGGYDNNTSDDASSAQNKNTNEIRNNDDVQKQLFQQHPELKKDIALFSNLLDKLAASVDGINSHSDGEVKRRKKQLSNKIVCLMNEMDRMLASLNLVVK